MTRDKIKPILFSIIKHQDPEQLKRQIPRDIVAGIVVAISRPSQLSMLPLVASSFTLSRADCLAASAQ